MDSKTYASNLSEAKVVADLAQKSFHTFTQTSGKAPFDVVAVKENKLYRIQIKACYKPNKSGGHVIQLRTIHPSATKGNKIVKFDASKCDLLAVYLIDLDKIFYLEAAQFHNKSTVSLKVGDPRFIEP